MALSDCPKCWDTPCTCGANYRNWSVSKLTDHIAVLVNVLREKVEAGDKDEERPLFNLARITLSAGTRCELRQGVRCMEEIPMRLNQIAFYKHRNDEDLKCVGKFDYVNGTYKAYLKDCPEVCVAVITPPFAAGQVVVCKGELTAVVDAINLIPLERAKLGYGWRVYLSPERKEQQ